MKKIWIFPLIFFLQVACSQKPTKSENLVVRGTTPDSLFINWDLNVMKVLPPTLKSKPLTVAVGEYDGEIHGPNLHWTEYLLEIRSDSSWVLTQTDYFYGLKPPPPVYTETIFVYEGKIERFSIEYLFCTIPQLWTTKLKWTAWAETSEDREVMFHFEEGLKIVFPEQIAPPNSLREESFVYLSGNPAWNLWEILPIEEAKRLANIERPW